MNNVCYSSERINVNCSDDLDRLTGERHYDVSEALTYNADYAYDLAGNRTQTVINGVTNTYALGLGNRLDTWTGGSYSHNDAGCVTSITDAAGTRELVWDGQYRLTGVSTNGVLAESYGFDPLGRRAWTSDGSVTNWHVHDGMHVIADLDNSGTVLRSYTWGPGIDNLLAITVHDAVTNTYYAITDRLSTVHALADETGSIVESYRFDAWGNVLEVRDQDGLLSIVNGQWSSPLGNRFLFQGREYSWATGLYNFRARWYDPVTGRWLSKDPIGISGGLDQYVAFANNPVMFIDPDGEAILEFGAAKGLYVGGKYLAYKATPYVIAGGTWVAKKGQGLYEKSKPVAERALLSLHKLNHDFHFGERKRDVFSRSAAGVGDAWLPKHVSGPGHLLSGSMANQYKYASNVTKLIKDGAIPVIYWLSEVNWPSFPRSSSTGTSAEVWGHNNIVHQASSQFYQDAK